MRTLVFYAVLSAFLFGMLLFFYLHFWHFDFEESQVDALLNFRPALLTEVLDEKGQSLIELPGLENDALRTPYYRRWVSYEEIPQVMVHAAISAEDKRFFEHHGVDFLAIGRAAIIVSCRSMWQSLRWGRPTIVFAQGASTVDQQVVRLLFLKKETALEHSGRASPFRKIRRKLKEIRMALWLEKRLEKRLGTKERSKQKIFEVFANVSYCGHGRYGFASASEFYFGTRLEEVDAPRAAVLAGIIRDPRKYSPILSPESAKARRDWVLFLMQDGEYLTKETAREYQSLPIFSVELPREKTIAPAVVSLVLKTLWDSDTHAVRWENGCSVTTTINKEWQIAANDALQKGLDAYRSRHKGDEKKGRVQGAVVVLSNTGEIKALVGGENGKYVSFNRATEARRQPGSAFKPFVYGAAFENGWRIDCKSPGSGPCTLEDTAGERVPMGRGRAPHEINNYDGRFLGEIELWQALAESRNIPTVRLARAVGSDVVATFAHRFGLNKEIEAYPTTALGAEEVTPLELASAYTVFANGGVKYQPRIIASIKKQGSVKEEVQKPDLGERVVSAEVAREVTKGLRHAVRWKKGTGRRLSQNVPFAVAGKTGTTNDFRDAWFCGFTYGFEGVTVCVWVGIDDNTPLGDGALCKPLDPLGREFCEPGGRVALPIFEGLIKEIYKDTPPPAFPAGIEESVSKAEQNGKIVQ